MDFSIPLCKADVLRVDNFTGSFWLENFYFGKKNSVQVRIVRAITIAYYNPIMISWICLGIQ